MSISQKQSRKLLADPDHAQIYHKLMKADCVNALTYLSAASMLLEDRLFDTQLRSLVEDVLACPEHIIPAYHPTDNHSTRSQTPTGLPRRTTKG